jgi:hypothetical protein
VLQNCLLISSAGDAPFRDCGFRFVAPLAGRVLTPPIVMVKHYIYSCFKTSPSHCSLYASCIIQLQFCCIYHRIVVSTDSTEHRDRVLKTLTSYSGGPGFISRPRHRLSLLGFFVFFPQSLQRMPGNALKLGHYSFFPNPFELIVRSYILLSY